MCGICGIVNYKKDADTTKQLLFKMRDIMQHRGPDGSGFYMDRQVALGHRRLSIIDLSGGSQPMTNEDSSVWIIYNGEIYNFQELRDDLISKGHQFKTRSDTEVLLHLYEEYQEGLVKHLNGMFAFAVWDKKSRKLLIVRDRLGVKPIYYMLDRETFIFASEIKSILKYLPEVPSINEPILAEYFSFRFPSGENTFFSGIKNLLPGHYLWWENGNIKINKYWDVEYESNDEEKSDAYYIDALDELLADAISLRLISDVPLGTFNSGGVDSSLISSYVAKMTDFGLNTFSVGFDNKDYDERKYAHIVAKQYHTSHHDLVIDMQEYMNLLPKIIWHHDEPLNHAHSIQIFKISQLAKEYVTVVLTGEGSDELFAGYPRYNLLAFSRLGSLMSIKLLVEAIAKILGNRKLRILSRFINYDKDESLVRNSEFVPLEYVSPLFNNGYFKKTLDRRYEILNSVSNSCSKLNRLLYLEQKTYLVSLLNRQDKMSMAASIESRVPFLDYRLVEFSFKVPERLKMSHLENKIIIKLLALKYLPRQIVFRKKSGFGVPISEWLRDAQGLRVYLDLVREKDSITQTYFNPKLLSVIISEHQKRKVDHGEFLWALINFELWYRIFYKNENL